MQGYRNAVLVLGMICAACTDQRRGTTRDLLADSLTRVKTDSLYLAAELTKLDSIHQIFLAALAEPRVDTMTHEVFRFCYSPTFRPARILRVERLPDSSYRLYSMVLADKTYTGLKERYPKFRLVARPDRTDSLTVAEDTQAITETEWYEFKSLLWGSYFWTFTNPMPDDGIFDGESLSLKSKSYWPRRYGAADTLTMHHNSVHCPFKGTYTDAYDYLERKSVLFRNLRWPRTTWR